MSEENAVPKDLPIPKNAHFLRDKAFAYNTQRMLRDQRKRVVSRDLRDQRVISRDQRMLRWHRRGKKVVNVESLDQIRRELRRAAQKEKKQARLELRRSCAGIGPRALGFE